MTKDRLIVICGYAFLMGFVSVVFAVTGLYRKLITLLREKSKKKGH